jgi:Mn2+/Fe2+ NRAMP family transporter
VKASWRSRVTTVTVLTALGLIWVLVLDNPWESYVVLLGVGVVLFGLIFLLARYFAKPS